MSSLRITKTDGLIGIKTTPAKMNISQSKIELEINQKQSKVIINKEPMQIKIDQSQCFNEAGLKNNSALSEDMVQRATQNFLQGLNRTVSEGNTLAAIENNVNALAEIAANNFIQVADWNIDFIPKSRPKIEFVGGNMDISVDEGYVEINARTSKPIIDVEIGGVEIYLRQKPELNIEFIGDNLDETI